MEQHRVVSGEEWLAARRELLAKEKEFTGLRDELSRLRRALPWQRVDKPYQFEGGQGKAGLGDLFDGRSQLIVQHFMFDPGWDAGCKSCSFWADNFDGFHLHLNQRDVTLVAVSRAPWPVIARFKERMGWSFPWVSSAGSDFNFDYGVSFTGEQLAAGEVVYNYAPRQTQMTELPGISVFCQGRARRLLPHLFLLCARARHDERLLSLPRSRPQRTRRGRPALSPVLGAPSRQLRHPRYRSAAAPTALTPGRVSRGRRRRSGGNRRPVVDPRQALAHQAGRGRDRTGDG